MSVVAEAKARDEAEIAASPEVWFVQPHIPNPDARAVPFNPIYAILLPQDTRRFVLIDDPDGFDVMFKYRGRWRNLSGVCWMQDRRPDGDPADNFACSVVTFGRRILRKHGVREMTWKQWQNRK